MKAYVTKYALTTGILVVDGEVSTTSSDMLIYKYGSDYPQYAHKQGKDWHTTVESAVAQSMKLREKKLRSLRKSLADIEAITEQDFVDQCSS